jgi:fructokinase
VGKIVSLGEVVADVYREDMSSEVEMPFTARPGGAPANVAVAAAKLGAEAAFVGSLGDDLFGRFVLRSLEVAGVDASAAVRRASPARTTLAFVEVSEEGDRGFTFYRSEPAADEMLSEGDVRPEALSGASFASVGSISLSKEPVSSATLRFAELAAQMGVPVALDVNFREHLWEGAAAAREAVDPLFDLATVVKLADDELEPILGVRDPEAAADSLLARGAHLVLVSKGRKGAFYATRTFGGVLPSFEIDGAVDATGAGDAFFAAALVHLSGRPGWPSDEATVREAVRRGAAAGALACTDYGAMRALPTGEGLERFLDGRT